MSGVHTVGDVGRFEPLLRTWAANGLQAVLSVKPEGANGALLREILPTGTLVGRITNNSTLKDSAIQQAYEADPKTAAAWVVGLCLPAMNAQPQFNAWQFNNEPVFGDGAETRLFRIRRLCEFMREVIDLANAQGHGVALFNFARGTPEPHEWFSFYEVWRYALSKNRTLPAGRKNILCLHQYGSFNKAGAGSLFYDEAWHIKRFETQIRPSLPADLKAAEYFVNESGPDGGQQTLKGWKEVYGQNDAGRQALVTDWRIHNEWLATQAGCLGACFFTLGQEGSFDSFNIENDPVAQMLANAHYPTMKPATTQPAPPPPVPVPPTVERVRLRIPYASQLAPVDQANYGVGDCLQAVITQLARASGRVVTVNDVARLTGLPRGYLSSHIITHGVNVARQLGIRLLWAGRLEPEDLKEEIRAGRSVILRVWYPFLMKRFDMNYSQYHFITVHGFEGDTFFYDDPYWRKQSDGEDIAITAAQLRRAAWRAAGGATPAQGLLVRGMELVRSEAA